MTTRFILIGPSRGGTTSLYHYLNQHPRIFMSAIKETKFFAHQAVTANRLPIRLLEEWPVTDWRQYQDLFKGSERYGAAGEASPVYFYLPHVPEQIRARLPGVKLLTVLRNPVERAYSNYLKYVRDGFETRSFEQAVQQELDGTSRVSYSMDHYVRIGFYHQHLTRYLQVFERGQLGIFLYDDFARAPAAFMSSMFAFLNVDPGFTPDMSARFNRGGVPKTGRPASLEKFTRGWKRRLPQRLYLFLHRLYGGLQEKTLQVPPIPPEIRSRLRDLYRPDIEKLQGLAGRDLSAWLEA
jgi:hypothetical protein